MNQHNQKVVKVMREQIVKNKKVTSGRLWELRVDGRVIATANEPDELEETREFLDSVLDEVANEAYDEGQDDCEHCDDCDDAYEDGRERGIEEGESNCEECPECEECDDCPESEHEVERN